MYITVAPPSSGQHIQCNHSGLSQPVTKTCMQHRGCHKDWTHGGNSIEYTINIRTGHNFSPVSPCCAKKTSALPKRWNIHDEPVVYKFCMLCSSCRGYHHWTGWLWVPPAFHNCTRRHSGVMRIPSLFFKHLCDLFIMQVIEHSSLPFTFLHMF